MGAVKDVKIFPHAKVCAMLDPKAYILAMWLNVFVFLLDAEFWVESDSEIEEDITLADAIIPSHLPDELVEESGQADITIRWVVTLLSVFQTQFYLTNRALSWLLTFLFVLFRFLGRYSEKVARLAHQFPSTLHQSF